MLIFTKWKYSFVFWIFALLSQFCLATELSGIFAFPEGAEGSKKVFIFYPNKDDLKPSKYKDKTISMYHSTVRSTMHPVLKLSWAKPCNAMHFPHLPVCPLLYLISSRFA